MKDIFEECGVPMERSVNSREQFAAHVHSALAEEVEPGIPRLQILGGRMGMGKGCPYLIKAIPLQRFNPKKPLALADQAHDHPVVALAYFLISHASVEKHSAKQRDIKPWMRPKVEPKFILGNDAVRVK